MNTKFIRDEHGLRLELMPANDNERVLVAELLSKSRFGYKTKNITVSGSTDKFTLSRPVYLSKKELSHIGFKTIKSNSSSGVYCAYKKVDNKLYVVIGSGEFFLFVINDILKEPEGVAVYMWTSDISHELEMNFEDSNTYIELLLSDAKKVRTVVELEELLKN